MNEDPVAGPLSQAWVGTVFTSPVTGETIEVLEVGRDAEGEVLRGRLTVAPGGSGPPRHVHPRIQETFHVESGELAVWMDGQDRRLGPGESIRIPPGTPHGFENPYDDPVVFEGVSRPGLRLIHALATLFGLAREGRLRADGTPRFLQAMVFARAMEETLYLASPPFPIQRALWTLFAPIGRLRGYRPTYSRFLQPDNWTSVS